MVYRLHFGESGNAYNPCTTRDTLVLSVQLANNRESNCLCVGSISLVALLVTALGRHLAKYRASFLEPALWFFLSGPLAHRPHYDAWLHCSDYSRMAQIAHEL